MDAPTRITQANLPIEMITRTIDENEQPIENYEITLSLLARSLMEERCLVFLGAGASISSGESSLPSAKKLSEDLAKYCHLEWHESIPLSTIAFYYENLFTREFLNEYLKKTLDPPNLKPSETIFQFVNIIRILEENNKKTLVLTTNYDRLFEIAYEDEFKRQPEVVIYNGGLDPNLDQRLAKDVKYHEGLNEFEAKPEYWDQQQSTCLYKMHGCISRAVRQNLVITEEDYINFLAKAIGNELKQKILLLVERKIALAERILFIGYSLTDWNFRVLLRAFRGVDYTNSFAVQYYDQKVDAKKLEAAVKFWKQHGIQIINVDAADFVKDLENITRSL